MALFRLTAGILTAASLAEPAPPDATPSPPERAPLVDADWAVTLAARRALWTDPALTGLNIGVCVRRGEALVWGPVFSEQQSAEAVARVRLVPGVRAVVNELYVLTADDPLRLKLTPAAPMGPPTRRPAGQTASYAPVAAPTGVRPLAPDFRQWAEEIRLADPRFRDLRVEWIGGVATVGGVVALHSDTLEFAERLRSLPGVDRVILRANRAAP
jgi:hypothetical protein